MKPLKCLEVIPSGRTEGAYEPPSLCPFGAKLNTGSFCMESW